MRSIVPIQFILATNILKDIREEGHGKTVASESLELIAYIYFTSRIKGYDEAKILHLIQLALFHQLHLFEGKDSVKSNPEREVSTQKICVLLKGYDTLRTDILTLWYEYHEQTTPEAQELAQLKAEYVQLSQDSSLYLIMEEFKGLSLTKRSGWNYGEVHDVKDPESVSAHEHGHMILIYVFTHRRGFSTSALLAMFLESLIHDLPEKVTGDPPSHDKTPEEMRDKHHKEAEVIEQQISLLDEFPAIEEEMLNLWYDYADRSSPEAQIVADLDKLEGVFQCLYYLLRRRSTRHQVWIWLRVAARKLKTPEALAVALDLQFIILSKFNCRLLTEKEVAHNRPSTSS